MGGDGPVVVVAVVGGGVVVVDAMVVVVTCVVFQLVPSTRRGGGGGEIPTIANHHTCLLWKTITMFVWLVSPRVEDEDDDERNPAREIVV